MIVQNVVIGIVTDQEDRILIAKRPPSVVSPGFWEFPGGKVEQGESLENALKREFQEEIGIVVSGLTPFMVIDKGALMLHVFQIAKYAGIAQGCENQEIRWVVRSALGQYTFLPANGKIIAALSA